MKNIEIHLKIQTHYNDLKPCTTLIKSIFFLLAYRKTPQACTGPILVQNFFTQIWSRELAAKASFIVPGNKSAAKIFGLGSSRRRVFGIFRQKFIRFKFFFEYQNLKQANITKIILFERQRFFA